MTSTTLPDMTPAPIQGAVRFDMASKISGRTYRILVFQPPTPPPPEGYPVMVVTDASLTFATAATMSAAFGLNGGRSALVVGVGYPAADDDYLSPFFLRTRDLTSPTPLSAIRPQPGMPPPREENFGGSEAFFRFLTEELRPAIAGAYPVDADDQTLYGHSLGGLFALEVLFRHPGAFRSFVASSPSIWWNSRAVLELEEAFARRIEAGEATPRVLVTIGAAEQEPPATPPPNMTAAEIMAMLTEARMVDNARELGERLCALKGTGGYVARFHAFEAEDHMTVVPASISRALVFALRPAKA
jgi:predicted alpha/beta superfamily hydrolase